MTARIVAAVRRWLRAAGDWLATREALLVLPVVVGWLMATFVALTMQGWWFPGRQVVVVLPLAAVAMAMAASRLRWLRRAILGTGVAGLVTTAWLLVDGVAGRLAMIVDFARAGSPVLHALRPAMPNYLDITAGTWVRHVAWLVVLVLLAAVGWRSGGRDAAPATARHVTGAGGVEPQPSSDSVAVVDELADPDVLAEPDEPDELDDPEDDSSPEPSSSRTSAPSSEELQPVAPAASRATVAMAAKRERSARMGRKPVDGAAGDRD